MHMCTIGLTILYVFLGLMDIYMCAMLIYTLKCSIVSTVCDVFIMKRIYMDLVQTVFTQSET